MNSEFLDIIKNTLGDLTTLTPEKLQALVKETAVAFQDIQAKMTSKNEGDREEGLRIANELKAAMEDRVQQLHKKLNMSPEQVEEYVSNPANFTKEQFKSMDASKTDLEHFKTQLQEKNETPIKKRKNKHMIVC